MFRARHLLSAAVLCALLSCGPKSLVTRVGDEVILPRNYCAIDIYEANEKIEDAHKVVGHVEVWRVGDDREALEHTLQDRSCRLGAEAVINLHRRDDGHWFGDAVVWQSHADHEEEPVPTGPAQAPIEIRLPREKGEPPPPPEMDPESSVEEEPPPPPVEEEPEEEEEEQPQAKRKGKKKKRKKRRRRR